MADITFRKLTEHDYADFRDDVKRIFSIAVVEAFGKPKGDDEIIRDDEIDVSLYNSKCEVLAVYADGEKVGGIVVKLETETQQHWLELFYIYPDKHGKGLGTEIWQGLELRYPDTKVWRLITPYFEKRNIHFYVNKCGFKIVEFFNKAHRDINRPFSGNDFHDEYFIFEKVMR